MLAADTDGIDSVEDNAGTIVGPNPLACAAALALTAQEFLDRNNACDFFAPLAGLVVQVPTVTDFNDFRALLVA